jgi:exosortase
MLEQGWIKNDTYALTAAATVSSVVGFFLLFFGAEALHKARFALLFLLLMLPLPSIAEGWVIRVLQFGSAEFVGLLFPLTGAPVLREGTVFYLPGTSIEVAPQCSGIRSSLALLITAVLAGHLYLKNTWTRVLLALAVIPLTMFKNAIRIVVLSLLGVYVDRGFLESSLHRDGGILFFILALMIMAPVLIVLRRSERNR